MGPKPKPWDQTKPAQWEARDAWLVNLKLYQATYNH